MRYIVNVTADALVTATLDVEADSEEQARDMVLRGAMIMASHFAIQSLEHVEVENVSAWEAVVKRCHRCGAAPEGTYGCKVCR